MLTLYYISFICFVVYVFGNLVKYGIPESLSETAYLNTKHGPLFFLLFAICTALPLMVFWLTITAGQTFQFLAFLACISLVFTASAWRYKGGLDRKVHMASAFLTATCSLIWSAIYTPVWPFILALVALMTLVGCRVPGKTLEGPTKTSFIFMAEIAGFVSLYISTYVYYLMLI